MQRISAARQKELKDIVSELEQQRGGVYQASVTYNEEITHYNHLLGKARNLTEEIASEQEDYISERSDTWQLNDRGTAYENWFCEWEGIDLENEEEIEEFEPEHITNLEALPTEPEAVQ